MKSIYHYVFNGKDRKTDKRVIHNTFLISSLFGKHFMWQHYIYNCKLYLLIPTQNQILRKKQPFISNQRTITCTLTITN